MFSRVLAAFNLESIEDPKQIFGSLTNQTYFVRTKSGEFIVQKLHPTLPAQLLQDMHAVTEHLATQGILAPRLLKTTKGDLYIKDEQSGIWRAYTYTPGVTMHAIPSLEAGRAAGEFAGVLHKALQTSSYHLQSSVPHFHDTPYIMDQLRARLLNLPEDLQHIAQDVLAQVSSYYLQHERTQIIHGDLKISNLLFNEELNQVVGVIDFDTLLERDPLIDLGDAYRSWCNLTQEDDANAIFNLEYFDAIFSGYAQGFPGESKEAHLRAAKLITLELTARFLIDVVADNYFSFDNARYESRQAHNRARALGQYHLAQSIPV